MTLTLQQAHALIYDAFEGYLGSEDLPDVLLSSCDGTIRLDADDKVIVVTCRYEPQTVDA